MFLEIMMLPILQHISHDFIIYGVCVCVCVCDSKV